MHKICVSVPAQLSENLGISRLFVHTFSIPKTILRTTNGFVSSLSSALSDLFMSTFTLLAASLCTVSTMLITKTIYLKKG